MFVARTSKSEATYMLDAGVEQKANKIVHREKGIRLDAKRACHARDCLAGSAYFELVLSSRSLWTARLLKGTVLRAEACNEFSPLLAAARTYRAWLYVSPGSCTKSSRSQSMLAKL